MEVTQLIEIESENFWMEAAIDLNCSGDIEQATRTDPGGDNRDYEMTGKVTGITMQIKNREVNIKCIKDISKYPLLEAAIEAALTEHEDDIMESYSDAAEDEEYAYADYLMDRMRDEGF